MTERASFTSETSSEEVWLKHLDFIQSIVARMSRSSTQAKSWLLPVATATLGYALTQKSATVALLGIASIFLFCYVDASYLRQEQGYRRLYNAVAERKPIPQLSLDPNDADREFPDADGETLTGQSPKTKKGFKDALCETVRGWVFADTRVWFSWSIFPFYGGFFVVGIMVFCWVAG